MGRRRQSVLLLSVLGLAVLLLSADTPGPFTIRKTHPDPGSLNRPEIVYPGSLDPRGIPVAGVALQVLPSRPGEPFCFTPDGRYLIKAAGQSVAWIDAASGVLLKTVPTDCDGISDLAVSVDGREILLAGNGPGIMVMDFLTGAVTRRLSQDSQNIFRLCLSPDGRLLAGESRFFFDDFCSCSLTIWDYQTGEVLWSGEYPMADSTGCSFNADSTRVLVPIRPGYGPITLKLIDARTGELVSEKVLDEDRFSPHGFPPVVFFQPLTDRPVYIDDDFGLGFLNREMNAAAGVFYQPEPNQYLSLPAVSADGSVLCAVKEKAVLIFTGEGYSHLSTLNIDRTLGDNIGSFRKEVGVSPDGERIFVNTESPFFCNTRNGQVIPLKTVTGVSVEDLVWANDGKALYSLGQQSGNVIVTRLENVLKPEVFLGHRSLVLSGNSAGLYQLVSTGQGVLLLERIRRPGDQAAYELNIRSADTGDLLYHIFPLGGRTRAAVFPDGRRLLLYNLKDQWSDGRRLTLRVIDLESGRVLTELDRLITEGLPPRSNPWEENFLYRALILPDDRIVLEYLSDSYWCGRGESSTIGWNIREPFDLESCFLAGVSFNRWVADSGSDGEPGIPVPLSPENGVLLSRDSRYLVKWYRRYPGGEGSPADSAVPGKIVVCNAVAGDCLFRLAGPEQELRCAALSGGNILAAGAGDGTIQIIDIATGRLMHTVYLLGPAEFVSAAGDHFLTNSHRTTLFPAAGSLTLGIPLISPDRITGMARLNDSGVRLRAFPDTRAEILENLNTGSQVTVLCRSGRTEQIGGHDAPWYLVVTGSGIRGWIYGAFLDLP